MGKTNSCEYKIVKRRNPDYVKLNCQESNISTFTNIHKTVYVTIVQQNWKL